MPVVRVPSCLERHRWRGGTGEQAGCQEAQAESATLVAVNRKFCHEKAFRGLDDGPSGMLGRRQELSLWAPCGGIGEILTAPVFVAKA